MLVAKERFLKLSQACRKNIRICFFSSQVSQIYVLKYQTKIFSARKMSHNTDNVNGVNLFSQFGVRDFYKRNFSNINDIASY